MNLSRAWRHELYDFVRAFSGAFLFGVPFLWTMEMWWIGATAELWKLFLFLLLVFLLNVHLAYFTGFKDEEAFSTHVSEAIEAMAVGVVTATVVLLALNRITPGDPLGSVLGQIVVQAIPLSIGAAAANALLGDGQKHRLDAQSQDGEKEDEARRLPAVADLSPWRATLNDLGATITGGLFVGFAIAPTDEISMLAAEVGPWHEVSLMALSLLVSYAIVFESGFSPRIKERSSVGYFQRPLTETIMAYLVSLLVAAFALYFFDRIDLGESLTATFSQVVVLGLPISLGGAAGRVVV
ncbi:MAG: TIGR02587 family membrane protein [Candidatus Promineifilaceae bacterium]|nr:TIGR02587 family membrane protein [Candidatus Promineifilaceae bacterium]